MKKRILTGITPSGLPHLGNYAGAIRPSVAVSRQPGVDAFYFIADYHALIKSGDPQRIARSRLHIAATWLACGLDPEQVTFYRQSDIPEIPQLAWFLTCVTAKGLLNRAHAYKAAVDKNSADGEDADAGVTAGLYMYPVLMGADILAFDAQVVPVGRDQLQHIEMARDMAQRFNHRYQGEYFVLPEALIEQQVAILPGLDGRKMSKSYDNTIPLFEGGSKRLRESILRIVTDSRAPGEPKDPEGTALAALFQAFASAEEYAAFCQSLREGLGWGEAKEALYQRIQAELAPLRERYESLAARPQAIEEIFQEGARKARALTTPKLAALRDAIGLGSASALAPSLAATPVSRPPRLASFRDGAAGLRFRLFAGDGEELALSLPFVDPKEAGQVQRRLKSGEAELHWQDRASQWQIRLNGRVVAASDVLPQDRREAHGQQLRVALTALAAQE